MALALAATALELATMVPYLAAVALIAGAGPTCPVTGAALAGYCLVMVLPAVLAAAVRIVAHARAEPGLRRVDAWFTRNGAKAVG
ncbi:GAP family protein [Actinomadura sp. LOL_016]|uniref:GAP family protein n=1 Tax=unclassified Actinomadura TaxID=2626254 RepID=UPI003A807A64